MVTRQLNADQEWRVQVCQDSIELLQTEPDLLRSRHWWWDMDLWVQPGNQAPEQLVKIFDVSESEESKAVKSWINIDYVLRCERHHQYRVLSTGPDDQLASFQRDPAVYASLGVREEMRVMAGKIEAASPWQCICPQSFEHPTFPGWVDHHRTGKTSLFTGFCLVWLFSFLQAQRDHQGEPFWRRGSHQEGHNYRADRHLRRTLPAL